MLLSYFDRYARDMTPYKGGSWCYEDGLFYLGMARLHQATGEVRWLDHLNRTIEPQLLDGPALKGYEPSEYNIDNILSGRALIYLYELTGRARYLDYARLLIDQLATHPRTQSGVYWHKLRYPWQVWLDGIFMGAPFQISYGLVVGEDALVEDSLLQVAKALEMTFVPRTGLYAHAMDEARKQPWAHPQTGHSTDHWARALGWLAMALVDIAELVGPERFAPLAARTRALMADIARLRCKDGMWLQVIDMPDLDGNYQEASASAMFVYALLRASRLGLYDGAVDGLLDLLTARKLAEKPGGGQEMIDVCHVAGLGMYENRFRDGTGAYYVSETLRNDDIKGVGPLMMAAADDLRFGTVPASDLAVK